MSHEGIDKAVEENSTRLSFNDELNDHRNQLHEGESGGIEDTAYLKSNESQIGYFHAGSQTVVADNSRPQKLTGRRGSFVGRSRASSVTKLTSSIGKKMGQKEDDSWSSANMIHDTSLNDGSSFNESNAKKRRGSRISLVSEVVSTGSRSSQETAEDVCFPMEQKQVKMNGIDFGVINEFIKEEKQHLISRDKEPSEQSFFMAHNNMGFDSSANSGTPRKYRSSAQLKYTPKKVFKLMFQRSKEQVEFGPKVLPSSNGYENKQDFDSDDSCSEREVKFGGARITDGTNGTLPDRFSFFHSESEETVHAPDIPSLVSNGESIQELFHNGEETWWLDCTCPTDAEMKMLAKAFGIHPLTAEDVRMQETREKVELFKNYYFVCFHTFEADKESEDYLEPINVYIVVFRDGILTFHFSPLTHPASVRRRVRQLRDYVDVTADWLCYAMIDDITDSFAPVIHGIEYEADAIEDAVFTARDTDFSNMLQRIGESRRKVMTLMRLLSGKADVIKMFAKRCQDKATVGCEEKQWRTHQDSFPQQHVASSHKSDTRRHEIPLSNNPDQQWQQKLASSARPRADIALYLGDIQDHIITMFQSLLAYEKIFSRSHSNYLAQLQVESLDANNKITQMFSKVTIIGTMLIPLNLVTGLFGMNVTVPGQDGHRAWFYGILGVILLLMGLSVLVAECWLRRINRHIDNERRPVFSARRSFQSLKMKHLGNRSVNSFV